MNAKMKYIKHKIIYSIIIINNIVIIIYYKITQFLHNRKII